MSDTRGSSTRIPTGLIALGAALLAAVTGPDPTASRVGDVVVLAGLGLAVALAGSRARPWTVLLAAGVAAGTTTGPVAAVAWATLLAAVGIVIRRGSPRMLGDAGAVVASVAYLCLLHQSTYGFHGAPLLVGGATTTAVLVSGYRGAGHRSRRRARRLMAAVATVGVVATVAFTGALLLAMHHLDRGSVAAERALDQARAGRTASAGDQVEQAAREFALAQARLSSWWAQPARFVPGVSQQAVAVGQLTDEGRRVASSGDVVQSASDYRSLKYQSGRIDLDQVAMLTAPVGDASRELQASADRLQAVDRSWLLPPLASKARSFEEHVVTAADDAATAHEVLSLLPDLLGATGDRHYFVAFLNPAEARGLGGFMGNYGELEAVDGRMRMIRSGKIADIEPAVKGVRTLDGPREFLERYGRFDPADYLRDASVSPHLPYVADVISQLYPQAGGHRVDGVVTMDPYALAALLELTGPIRVPGYDRVLTSDNLPGIALRQQYLDFSGRNDERKDLLVDLTDLAFDRLLNGDLPSPGRLIDVLGPMVRERRLMLWSKDRGEERLFEHMGADGRMPVAAGADAFLLAHQNFGNNKIDAYLQRSVDYRATVDQATGAVRATAAITLRNNAPAAGLPQYVIGNRRAAPDGTNLMNLTVYSALGLRSATLDGTGVSMGGSPEAGLNAYDLPVIIPPGGTARLVLHLEGGVDLRDGPYRLRLAPQGQVNPDRMRVSVDGTAAEPCGFDDQPAAGAWDLTETMVVGAVGCAPSP
jgi:hypothetical protein